MNTITVEWMHLDKDGQTCERCNNTGLEVKQIVERLNNECLSKQVQILFKETKLTEENIDKSNLILINGSSIESILPNTVVSESNCCSCGELTGKNEVCRTIIHFSEVYETIPQKLIREAICKVANCC